MKLEPMTIWQRGKRWVQKSVLRNPKRNFVPGHERVYVDCPMCSRPIEFKKFAAATVKIPRMRVKSFGGHRGIRWQEYNLGSSFLAIIREEFVRKAEAVLALFGTPFTGQRQVQFEQESFWGGGQRVMAEEQFRGQRE